MDSVKTIIEPNFDKMENEGIEKFKLTLYHYSMISIEKQLYGRQRECRNKITKPILRGR